MSDQTSVPVTEASQIGEARRVSARLAHAAGFDASELGRVTLVATELATNLARYGKGGRILVQSLLSAEGTTIEILAIDTGPGMADVPRCLQDGYSTGGTSGNGLGGVRRMSTRFDIYSAEGRGTVVMARIGGAQPSPASPRFRWGVVSLPAPNEQVCGDSWRVAERGREIAVMVADGLGHGPLAAEAAERAAVTFDRYAFEDPRIVVEQAHRALVGSRGAAIALARVSDGSTVHYAGMGNISSTLVNHERSTGMVSQNGTIGVQIRKVQQMQYSWPKRGLLVMHSDGLTSRWSFDAYPGLSGRHPAVIAGVLARDFARGRDDATVLVVGDGESEGVHA